MTMPSLVFGFLVASLYGALFHLFRGGSLARLFLYLIFSWIGFAIGQLVGDWRNWILFPIGTLNLGMATIGSIVFLVAGYWFSLVRVRTDRGDDAI